jgi:hypothetical protein
MLGVPHYYIAWRLLAPDDVDLPRMDGQHLVELLRMCMRIHRCARPDREYHEAVGSSGHGVRASFGSSVFESVGPEIP